MSGITIDMARAKLKLWLEVEETLTTGQQYTIGARTLIRADLAEVRKQIEYWNNYIIRLERNGGRNRVFRVVPRDL